MKTVDYRKVLQAFHSLKRGIPQSPLSDDAFAYPSESWLTGTFWPWARRYLRGYAQQKYDCENFCEKIRTLLTECLAADDSIGPVGFACFIVTLDLHGDLNGVTDGRHATLLVLVDDGSEDGKLMFFEPQNGRITDAKTAVDSGVAVPVFICL